MTSCTGCNVSLGFKKYNFQKQWRIPGYFCRECMKKMGQDLSVKLPLTEVSKKLYDLLKNEGKEMDDMAGIIQIIEKL